MEAIIIEDEKLAAQRLKMIVHKVAPEINIKTKLPGVEEAVHYLQQEEPELIFMDIHLSDGSSFGIFERVKVTSPVIFTTAYDEYALKAFKVNSVDYLLKPVEEEALSQSLQKFKALKHGRKIAIVDYERLLKTFNDQKIHYKQRFLVSFGNKIKTIRTEDVAYFYADSKAVFLVEKPGSKYVLDETLDQLQETLDPVQYFRVNRGFLVSVDAIEQMYSYSRSRIKIDLKPAAPKECIVSTEKTPDFKTWLGQ
ncbi:LytR/AlgR family response regulator transcription factor [Nafulsella turpanensis]|uniref:LytR/AlgR family response regulator transcription factor n=1 Tax=Nafulsella turpanensis TaxID=1265690 RepID=UPI0003470239|nr:LytTR family DNA-binding domain-containing protein [Nafulsella turpanensis]